MSIFTEQVDTTPHVLVGMSAFSYNGLTTFYMRRLQLGSIRVELRGIPSTVAIYYFSPWALLDFETHPSDENPNVLIPTRERAICEYILLHEYFDEGILIEGLLDYLEDNNDNTDKLYEVARRYFPSNTPELLDYWLNEAREDNYTCIH